VLGYNQPRCGPTILPSHLDLRCGQIDAAMITSSIKGQGHTSPIQMMRKAALDCNRAKYEPVLCSASLFMAACPI
jgi:hypothetical protein